MPIISSIPGIGDSETKRALDYADKLVRFTPMDQHSQEKVGITTMSAYSWLCRHRHKHDFRHTFAVNSVIDAHRQGADVDARIAVLATYLGHVDPVYTYWYLTASPELMMLAMTRMPAGWGGQRR